MPRTLSMLIWFAAAGEPSAMQSANSAALQQTQPSRPSPRPPSAQELTERDLVLLRDALSKRDERTPRQRCLGSEEKKLGGRVSHLAASVIDLKCSGS